jgi:hypothetical protein
MDDDKPSKYDWLEEMTPAELRSALRQHETDLLIVYEKGGFNVMTFLWEHLAGIPLYPSKRAYYKLAAIYVRQNYDPDDPDFSKKFLAAKIGASLRFVELALSTTDREDKRQQKLFGEGSDEPR